METQPSSPLNRLNGLMRRRSFWVVLLMLAGITLLHYLTPQYRLLSLSENAFLSRHAIERMLFVLPVAIASFAFGQRGGVITLAFAILAMLPRALWISPHPVDALFETGTAVMVGYAVIWALEVQNRERRLHQRAVSRLGAINEITALVTRSLELEEILRGSLDRTLQVVRGEAGLIYTLDPQSNALRLAALRGVPEALAGEFSQSLSAMGLCEQVARSGEPAILQSVPVNLPGLSKDTLYAQTVVPLKSRGRVRGVLAVIMQDGRRPHQSDQDLLMAIGREIGAAIENAQLYQNMRSYARAITRAQEDERQRIARELHDETIQMLVALSRQLDLLSRLPDPLSSEVRERLRSMRELVGGGLRELRHFVRDLRPPVLDHLGLVSALRELSSDLKDDYGIEVELRITGDVVRLDLGQELVLFRIAQEALNNVRRHAGATQIRIILQFAPDCAHLVVEDNGRGFDTPEQINDLVPAGRLGLVGMDERARALGGLLAIRSTPGHGTTVTVDIPVQLELR